MFLQKKDVNDVLDEIKLLTEKALAPEATFTCMQQLNSLLNEIRGYDDVATEQLKGSQSALKQLQERIQKVCLVWTFSLSQPE